MGLAQKIKPHKTTMFPFANRLQRPFQPPFFEPQPQKGHPSPPHNDFSVAPRRLRSPATAHLVFFQWKSPQFFAMKNERCPEFRGPNHTQTPFPLTSAPDFTPKRCSEKNSKDQGCFLHFTRTTHQKSPPNQKNFENTTKNTKTKSRSTPQMP